LSAAGTTPALRSYSAHLTVTPDGDAYRLHWEISYSEPGRTARPDIFDGVGFFLGNVFYASRSYARPADNGAQHAGVVRYDTTTFGDLPARWYHPSLNGKVCHGRSTDGPTDRLDGSYTANYSSDEAAFATLVKTISKFGDAYKISWTENGEQIFSGVGFAIDGEFYSAWASPPRSDLHVLRYELMDGGNLSAAWINAENPNGVGTETLYGTIGSHTTSIDRDEPTSR
jgi:hypothetical protein